MVLQTLPIAERPSRVVEDVQILSPRGAGGQYERLPDGRTILVFREHGSGKGGDAYVFGPQHRAMLKTASGISRAIILRLKPGWAMPLFGVPASELTDRSLALTDVWGRFGHDFCEDLLAARSPTETLDRIERAIASQTQRPFVPSSAQLARRAIRMIEDGETRIDHVAQRLGVTSRHLRRAFGHTIGVGPKHFARTVRLRRAARMAETSKDWGRIAREVGYYDQAHLITEFRELVGLTPSAFRLRRERSLAEST